MIGKRPFLAACFALAISPAIVIGLGHSVQAAPIADDYIGANAHGYGDVIGSSAYFQIKDIEVTKVGSDLKVVVGTNYNPNLGGTKAPSYGTGFGDLFFGTDMSEAPTYGPTSVSDKYTAGRFTYAFDISNINNPGTTGPGTLYSLKSDGSEVKTSYLDPKVSGTFRDTQAVEVQGTPVSTGLTGSWTFDASQQTLTFLLLNAANTFGSTFFIAWAMTCANDVIYANITFPLGGNTGDVPLPAGFILMGTILLGAGGVARWRRRRMLRTA